VHNKVEELAKRHYRRVATTLNDCLPDRGFRPAGVGGHPHEVSNFIDFLPRDLRDRIAGTFTIDAKPPRRPMCAQREAIMDRYEQDEERKPGD
jgi:peptide chain release factor subunit 1